MRNLPPPGRLGFRSPDAAWPKPGGSGPGGQRYRKVTGYLHHQTRWIESFGGHRHYHRPVSWYIEQLVMHGLVVTGLHEPPSFPHSDIPETDWTEYQRWFSTIPTLLAISCTPSLRDPGHRLSSLPDRA